MQFNQKEYDKQMFDKITFSIPKGTKADLQRMAEDRGLTLSRLIVETLEDALNVDLHTRRRAAHVDGE